MTSFTSAADIEKAVSTTVHETISSFFFNSNNNNTSNGCQADLHQSLSLWIQDSTIEVNETFEARQRASISLACLNKMPQAAQLRQQLKDVLVQNIYNTLRGKEKTLPQNVSREKIRQIVDYVIDSSARCTANMLKENKNKTKQLQALTVDIVGSKIKVGCSDSTIERAKNQCLQDMANNIPPQNSIGCNKLEECSSNEGKILFESNLDISDQCSQVQNIALYVTAAAVSEWDPGTLSLVDENANKNTNATSDGWPLWQIIVVSLAGVVALALIILIVFIVSKTSKNKNKKKSVAYNGSPMGREIR